MAKGILLYKDIKISHKTSCQQYVKCLETYISRVWGIFNSFASYHDILGLVNSLNIIAVVMLGVVDLDIVVGDIQKDLKTQYKFHN